MALFDYMVGGLVNVFGSAIFVGIVLIMIFTLLIYSNSAGGWGAAFLFIMFSVYLFTTNTIGGNAILPQGIVLIPTATIGVGILVIMGLMIGLMFYILFVRD